MPCSKYESYYDLFRLLLFVNFIFLGWFSIRILSCSFSLARIFDSNDLNSLSTSSGFVAEASKYSEPEIMSSERYLLPFPPALIVCLFISGLFLRRSCAYSEKTVLSFIKSVLFPTRANSIFVSEFSIIFGIHFALRFSNES